MGGTLAPDGRIPSTGRILLLGRTGQLGGQLLETLAPLGEVVAPGRSTLDMTDSASIREMIRSLRPRWIVNPAAYTAVDKAETEPDLAFAVNAEAVRTIGREAQAIGAAVVHFSTDYVFDGTTTRPYTETDATAPLGVYGASKLAGEQALRDSGAAHLIFRTSWVYGDRGKNFLVTILKTARERDVLRVVADQRGAPTWSRDLARMTAHVLGRVETAATASNSTPPRADLPVALSALSGVYHASGSGETTWHGFATEALRLQQLRERTSRFARIDAISTAEYPTPARRPANSLLHCAKLAEVFGWTMPCWRDSLRVVLSEL